MFKKDDIYLSYKYDINISLKSKNDLPLPKNTLKMRFAILLKEIIFFVTNMVFILMEKRKRGNY